ncbi:serine hydrolase domain-containing protein [Flavobacteriaceae bacterium S356]|uniref:Serine hydrolase domain-containing protein n=1 Tax=Asprobacillus argus TaxID=3076534 RepID=A0ABU3LCI0_9FLAO|nr:serine hydrolase domain-containing protein [Flavobacteriaceae bacterium S356]
MKLRSIAAMLFYFFFFTSCGQNANTDVPAKTGRDLVALDNYVNTLEKQGIFGSFLLMENDKVLYEKSIGFANKEKQIKSHKGIVYPYGSIVKDYTLALILLLETEGKLNTSDKISKYFEDIPEDKQGITIGHLLKHTSGLGEYHDLDPKLKEKYKGYPNDLFPMPRKEALAYIFEQKLKFEPGSGDSYSNSGYTVLAYLAETVSGKSFDKAVQEYILQPAKTSKADFYSSPLWGAPEEVAVGYGRGSFGKENSAFYWPRNPGALIGNGGMSGTLKDLYLGNKYIVSLETSNPAFGKLAKKYKYSDHISSEYVGSAGGGDLGFVAFTFGIKSKNQYLLFASNNNKEGEDERMIRKLMILGFGFDVASIIPGEFADENKDESEVIKTDKGDRNKWGLPNKLKYDRIGGLLDLLSNKMSIDDFVKTHCGEKMVKKVLKRYKKWPRSNYFKYNQVTSYGAEMELIVKDSVTNKKYTFDLMLEPNAAAKFKNIKFKK